MGEVGVITFFVLEVPDYQYAMLMYSHIYIIYVSIYRRHEKTSYVSNYAFFTLLHK